MSNQLMIVLFSSLVALFNAVILAKYNRAAKREDERRTLLSQLQKDVDLLKAGYITADRLRILLKEELKEAFADFELRLINEGRLDPKRRKYDARAN